MSSAVSIASYSSTAEMAEPSTGAEVVNLVLLLVKRNIRRDANIPEKGSWKSWLTTTRQPSRTSIKLVKSLG